MDAQTDTSQLVNNHNIATDLEQELQWFSQVLQQRLVGYFDEADHAPDPAWQNPPQLGASAYGQLTEQLKLTITERLILVLCLTPHIQPQLLDVLLIRNTETQRGFTEFGGQLGSAHGGFLPTIETALFICAGIHLDQRFDTQNALQPDAPLIREGILQILESPAQEPWAASALIIHRDLVQQLTTGHEYHPQFNSDFPAKLIKTQLNWDHLILPKGIIEQLDEIRHWILYGDQLLDQLGMRGKLAPGFTSLFCGPPGTGKTLSACLLGKYCDSDVYKVDLSLMVSKYIGETEKNLARVFDTAEHRRWILFFDEADALFGKRTKVDDARDRYANQEISFLLQRVEEFDGVVILASNFKSNIDDAFKRRFQSIIEFPMPQAAERLKIWRNALPLSNTLEDDLELQKIADKYALSGGTILNAVRFASLRMLARGDHRLQQNDIEEGIRREYLKEGKRL
ncbi:ATP-binding protein [Gynuella sp.]|uniref:ATP-binding protein n=1 Tax=Gynuella sp. TaxID=2969146 RepID=UPI003D0C21D4